jgi:hypothetical protein
MKLHKIIKQADDSVFDEIIKACESKMVSPFKKEVEVVEVKPEMEASDEQEEADLSPEDIEELKRLLGKE